MEALLAPAEPAAFFREQWERQPFHIADRAPTHYADLFSSSALESVLYYARPKPPELRVVAEQQEMLPDKYVGSRGDLNLNQLYKAYAEGHTLVVNELQRFSPPVAALCRRLQDELSHTVVANCYLSPPHSRGLHPHYDTHDVFVLQIEGRKTWRLYGAPHETPLLLTFQPVIPDAQLDAPVRTVVLNAGDLLYMPRGHIHEAETDDQHSLHITLGIYPTQWHDMMASILTAASLRDVRFRRSLPPGFLRRPELRGELQACFQELLAAFAADPPAREGFDLLANRFLRQSVPVPDGHLGMIDAAESLDACTSLAKRDGMTCHVETGPQGPTLRFPGNSVSGTADYQEAMEHIAHAAGRFTAEDLPASLSLERRLTLVRRLVRSGLLRVVEGR
jgi:ribosomal protein L16 Arg81 hydroxylase